MCCLARDPSVPCPEGVIFPIRGKEEGKLVRVGVGVFPGAIVLQPACSPFGVGSLVHEALLVCG